MTLESDLAWHKNNLNTINAALQRGQSRGSMSPCDSRPNSEDCGVWRKVQSIPTKAQTLEAITILEKQIDDLKQKTVIPPSTVNQLGESNVSLFPLALIGIVAAIIILK